jgi:Domain of unknown function DUF1828
VKLDLCRDFQMQTTSAGFLIRTPFRYDDNDEVIVFADRQNNKTWVVHDNGEAALRLMFDGVDPFMGKIQTWIQSNSAGVFWNDKETSLERHDVAEGDLVVAAFKVAQASLQLQAMSSHRMSRSESTFRNDVLTLLADVARDAKVEAKFDATVDSKKLFTADCLFLVAKPLAIFIAPSTQRLLEAELAWSELRRLGNPMRVMAVIEDATEVGMKEFNRAQYFTDKTLSFLGYEDMFGETVKNNLLLS